MNARARTQKQKNPWVGEPFPTCKYTKKGAFAADNDKIVGKSVLWLGIPFLPVLGVL